MQRQSCQQYCPITIKETIPIATNHHLAPSSILNAAPVLCTDEIHKKLPKRLFSAPSKKYFVNWSTKTVATIMAKNIQILTTRLLNFIFDIIPSAQSNVNQIKLITIQQKQQSILKSTKFCGTISAF